MDLRMVNSGLALAERKKKWVLLCAAFGFTTYGLYRVYHLPLIAQKRKRLLRPVDAFISVAEAVSDSADALGVVSKDLKDFLQSNTDQIPNSFKQISKITNSTEFSKSVITFTQALTIGITRGCQVFKTESDNCIKDSSNFFDKFADKVFTPAGSGFASVVVGSFARNLIMGFYLDGGSRSRSNSNDSASVDKWVNVVCSENCKELIGDCVQLFVSTAVAVYLDKTMDVNTYDEFFSGLTNPKHDTRVRDVLVSVCNGAVETLVKASYNVSTSAKMNTGIPCVDQGQGEGSNEADGQEIQEGNSIDEVKDNGWISKVLSTFALPSNRRFVLDLTGRITFESVRSFLEFFLEKVHDAIERRVNVVHEAVVESGIEVVRFVTDKSPVIATVCFSLCLHILDGAWVLTPA
ncbi:hypothetical protein CFOL_v3_01275 [Cephalotus follicularis]|uniref:Uncharacterized protein n=1 Tax=Cephalotus follicularis TaxID=3775 RepID=A0A1Q3APU3_CEPFO|nr:hypothetical protein CFOL_v3_01275 [Cephalotus follicularis]